VLCRSILEKEISRPAYRDLLGVLFRLEARGEIRGGRFISGISGEQFALPSVASVLGDYRAAAETPHFCLISPADPLNMLGVLLPKETLASGALLVLKDGVPIAQKIGPRYFEFTEGGLAGFAPGVVSQPPRRATRAPASG
jgi:ATP-dependent Lhr-like helicase